jgi:hypothetical protein
MKTGNHATSLSAALRADREISGVKIETLAAAFSVSPDTMYRVLEGGWDEKFRDLVNAQQSALLPKSTRDAIRSSVCPVREEITGDLNGDGRVDLNDYYDGALRILDGSREQLKELRDQDGGHLLASEKSARLGAIEQGLLRVVEQMRVARESCSARQGPRVAG